MSKTLKSIVAALFVMSVVCLASCNRWCDCFCDPCFKAPKCEPCCFSRTKWKNCSDCGSGCGSCAPAPCGVPCGAPRCEPVCPQPCAPKCDVCAPRVEPCQGYQPNCSPCGPQCNPPCPAPRCEPRCDPCSRY